MLSGMAHQSTNPLPSMTELYARARKLGIPIPQHVNQPTLMRLIEEAEIAVGEPGNFGDLPDQIIPAPDEEMPDQEMPGDDAIEQGISDDGIPVVFSDSVGGAERPIRPSDLQPASEDPEEPDEPEEPEITLTAEEIAAAINGGDSGGIPVGKEQQAEVVDGRIVIDRGSQVITAMVGGVAVQMHIESKLEIVRWDTSNRGVEAKGKIRLLNDVPLASGLLKAGKEFYPHQINRALIEGAGGQFLEI